MYKSDLSDSFYVASKFLYLLGQFGCDYLYLGQVSEGRMNRGWMGAS